MRQPIDPSRDCPSFTFLIAPSTVGARCHTPLPHTVGACQMNEITAFVDHTAESPAGGFTEYFIQVSNRQTQSSWQITTRYSALKRYTAHKHTLGEQTRHPAGLTWLLAPLRVYDQVRIAIDNLPRFPRKTNTCLDPDALDPDVIEVSVRGGDPLPWNFQISPSKGPYRER